MASMNMLKKASWLPCFFILAISCLDEPDCFRLNNNFAGIAFKKMYDGEADTVALIGIRPTGTDSVFNQYVLTTGVYLNLNYFADQTTFAIESLDGGIQQVILGYDVKTQFVSEDCGARYVLSNLRILGATYDSIRLIDGTPASSQQGANIEIYRCPITNRMELSFRQLQAETSVALPIKINSITNQDGLAFHVDTTLQTVYLPLDPERSADEFTFSFASLIPTKKINLVYATTTATLIEKCSAQELIHDLDATFNDFDSLLIVKDSLQDPPVTNLIAYRCPDTNFMQVYFRKNGSPVRNDTINVKSVKDDAGNIFYQNRKLTYAVLPLNPNSNATEFTFEMQDATLKKMTVAYTRTSETLFDACGTDVLFSDITIPVSDFLQATVRSDSAQFPVITNVEIIR